MSFAEFVWFCSTAKGVADFEVTDHVVTQKKYEAVC